MSWISVPLESVSGESRRRRGKVYHRLWQTHRLYVSGLGQFECWTKIKALLKRTEHRCKQRIWLSMNNGSRFVEADNVCEWDLLNTSYVFMWLMCHWELKVQSVYARRPLTSRPSDKIAEFSVCITDLWGAYARIRGTKRSTQDVCNCDGDQTS